VVFEKQYLYSGMLSAESRTRRKTTLGYLKMREIVRKYEKPIMEVL
jgi:hypothetical protein